MENNENGFDKNSFSSDDGGYTQAPNNYNMNGQPMGNPYGQPEQGNQGFAIAGMVLGIVSLVCCCSGYFALVLGIIGFILSLVSLIQKKPGKGMAITGIVCSSIAFILIIVLTVIGNSVALNPTELDELMDRLESLQ